MIFRLGNRVTKILELREGTIWIMDRHRHLADWRQRCGRIKSFSSQSLFSIGLSALYWVFGRLIWRPYNTSRGRRDLGHVDKGQKGWLRLARQDLAILKLLGDNSSYKIAQIYVTTKAKDVFWNQHKSDWFTVCREQFKAVPTCVITRIGKIYILFLSPPSQWQKSFATFGLGSN